MDRVASWQVLISPDALKALSRIPANEREQVVADLRGLARGPISGEVVRLRGRPEWRLRVGKRRVLLRVDFDAKVIVATDIGSRGDIYKD